MKAYPPIPDVEDAPEELLESGHLWIQEKLDGAGFRFSLLESGVVRFGDSERVFDGDAVPPAFRHAVRHVRERLDREALGAAVADVESVVFFGEAMHKHAVDYDWRRTPSFLGFDVWDGERGRFLPPDATERTYERLGLDAVNTFQREVRAVDFDPVAYEIPDSAWYDGPAAGVVLRSKTGERAKIENPELPEPDESGAVDATGEEVAEQAVTGGLLDEIAAGLAEEGRSVTVDALYDRVIEEVLRAEHDRLVCTDVDQRAFRSTVAALVRAYVDES